MRGQPYDSAEQIARIVAIGLVFHELRENTASTFRRMVLPGERGFQVEDCTMSAPSSGQDVESEPYVPERLLHFSEVIGGGEPAAPPVFSRLPPLLLLGKGPCGAMVSGGALA